MKKKYDAKPYYLRGALLSLVYFVALAMLAVIVGLCSSCRSSRKVVERSTTDVRFSGRDSIRVDSLLQRGGARASEADTASVSDVCHGDVEIKRDSAGQVVKIMWTRSASILLASKSAREKERWFYGLNATRLSESRARVDSIGEKAQEVAQTVDARISLTDIVGPAITAVVFMYLLYVAVADCLVPWLRKRHSR